MHIHSKYDIWLILQAWTRKTYVKYPAGGASCWRTSSRTWRETILAYTCNLPWNLVQGAKTCPQQSPKLFPEPLGNLPWTCVPLPLEPAHNSFRPFVEMYTCKNYRIASHGNMEEKKQKAHSRVEYSTLPLSPSLRLGTQMTRAQLSECGANAGQFPFSSLVQSIFGRLVSSWTESTPFLGKWRTDLFVIGWESCNGIAALPKCELEQGVKSVIYDSDSAIEETTKKYFFCGTRVSAGAT